MMLKYTTVSRFKFQILNSLMELSGVFARPGMTVSLEIYLNLFFTFYSLSLFA